MTIIRLFSTDEERDAFAYVPNHADLRGIEAITNVLNAFPIQNAMLMIPILFLNASMPILILIFRSCLEMLPVFEPEHQSFYRRPKQQL